jgi:hypothetical protein
MGFVVTNRDSRRNVMSKSNKLAKKLSLNTETLRILSDNELDGANGGAVSVQSWIVCPSAGGNCQSAQGNCPSANGDCRSVQGGCK